jgi:hypothetical protein
MGAKLNSKTVKIHLQITFLDFLSHFMCIRLYSFQKVLIWPVKFFFDYVGTFQNFEGQTAWNGSKQKKTFFYKRVLE